MTIIFAADTGGTFTDLVGYNSNDKKVVNAKSLTTYDNLIDGVITCLKEINLPLDKAEMIKHGTTLVINTLLQRNGARVASVSTTGFRDVIEIGRGNRPTSFDLAYRRPAPLVPREMRFEIGGRIDGKGREIQPIDPEELDALAERLKAQDINAVAVSLLNSYLNDAHEAAVCAHLRKRLPDIYVTAGSELSREWYEYERTATTIANAYVGPSLSRYVARCKDDLGELGFSKSFYLMGSNGGVLSVGRAQKEPIMLVESGPVGGCIGAREYGRAMGISNIIAFDMGGTTAKASLVENDSLEIKSPYYVGGYGHGFPIRGAVVDIVEIGTGGGSIGWLDDQQRLKVGPRSAGSEPGPVAFGRGGEEPTVLDANLVLGRVGSNTFLGGRLKLDRDAAKRAVSAKLAVPLGFEGEAGIQRAAEGIIDLAILGMTNTIRQVTIERGRDTREFVLFVYGGSGPLHGRYLARELQIPTVIIPPSPGNFSAVGMLLADARRDVSQTNVMALEAASVEWLRQRFEAMEAEVIDELRQEIGEGKIGRSRAGEFRYKGQSHSLRVSLGDLDGETGESVRQRFFDAYERRYGHVDKSGAIQLVALHSSVYCGTLSPPLAALAGETPDKGDPVVTTRPVAFGGGAAPVEANVYTRSQLPVGFKAEGPAIIEEYGSTTLIGPGDRFQIGSFGEIRIDCTQLAGEF